MPAEPPASDGRPAAPRLRPAVRAVVMDPARRVLLVHFDFAADNSHSGFWACPGGGIDPGETAEDALARELKEELGLEILESGRPVWWKEHVFPMKRWDGQQDTFFWLEVEAFEPCPMFTEAELRDEGVDGMRWWSYEEIIKAQQLYDAGRVDDPAYVTFSPQRLGHLLQDLERNGRPAQPVVLPPL